MYIHGLFIFFLGTLQERDTEHWTMLKITFMDKQVNYYPIILLSYNTIYYKVLFSSKVLALYGSIFGDCP